jgi:hypothetical protein
MAFNDQTRQFADFLLGTSGDVATTRKQRFESWMGLHGSMLMMPAWARKMTGTYHTTAMERFILRPNEKLKSRLVRWAVGELPCRTMALARVSGATPCPTYSDTSDSLQQHAA